MKQERILIEAYENMFEGEKSDIDKIVELAKKFNFKEEEVPESEVEEGITNLKFLKLDDGEELQEAWSYIILWHDDDTPDDIKVNYYAAGPSGNDDTKKWTTVPKWIDVFFVE